MYGAKLTSATVARLLTITTASSASPARAAARRARTRRPGRTTCGAALPGPLPHPHGDMPRSALPHYRPLRRPRAQGREDYPERTTVTPVGKQRSECGVRIVCGPGHFGQIPGAGPGLHFQLGAVQRLLQRAQVAHQDRGRAQVAAACGPDMPVRTAAIHLSTVAE